MFTSFTNSPEPTRLTSLEVAQRTHKLDQNMARLVAGYRKESHKSGISLQRMLTALISSLR